MTNAKHVLISYRDGKQSSVYGPFDNHAQAASWGLDLERGAKGLMTFACELQEPWGVRTEHSVVYHAVDALPEAGKQARAECGRYVSAERATTQDKLVTCKLCKSRAGIA